MEKTLISRIEDFNKNLSPSSIKKYDYLLRKIALQVFNRDKPTLNMLKYPKKIIPFIERQENHHAKALAIACLTAIKTSPTFPPELRNYYITVVFEKQEEQMDKYKSGFLTEKEKANWTSFTDILHKKFELLDRIENEEFDNIKECVKVYLQYLILSLYTDLPPLRNDWDKVLVREYIPDNEILYDEFNYIDLKKKQLILCKYKTKKTYKQKRILMPSGLINIIKRWFSLRYSIGEGFTGEYLLVRHDTFKPMIHSCLYKYISEIFKPKKIGSNMIRKIYLSEKYPMVEYRGKLDKFKDSYIMGHGVSTQQTVYRRKTEDKETVFKLAET
jgi:hypothetical protein